MYYKIDAADTWAFRGALPFDAGISHGFQSLFPPFPSVYAGAFRTCASPVQTFSEIRTVSKAMRIGWNGVIADGRFLFPAPLDRYSESSDALAEKRLASAAESSAPLPCYLAGRSGTDKDKISSLGSLYLDESALGAYINGSCHVLPCVSLDSYIKKETRIGIRMDRVSRLAADHDLYQVTMIRPENGEKRCSLGVEASGLEIPEGTAVRFGGEGKIGYIHSMDTSPKIPNGPEVWDKKYFKLYLATPAIFEKGWLPGWIHERDLKGTFSYKGRSVTVRLLAAAIGSSRAAGGFGYKNEKGRRIPTPREMRYAVPAGSVYFFELLQGRPADVIKLFHRRCLSDYRETLGFQYAPWSRMRYCDRGFGYCLVANISDAQKGGCLDV